MKKKSISTSLLCLITTCIVASPPPPPGFGEPSGPPGFGEPSASFSPEPSGPMNIPHIDMPSEEPSAFGEPSESPSFGEPSGPPGFGRPGASFSPEPSRPMGMPTNEPMRPEESPAFGEPSERPELSRPSGPPGFGASAGFGAAPSFEPSHSGPSVPEEPSSSYPQSYNHMPSLPDSAAMQRAEEALDTQDSIVQEGINNFDVEGSGNWLLKRVWWEKTEEVYEEIKAVFNQVLETRSQFITARNKLDRELDIFYGEMGLEQGPLNDIITHILDLMEKLRKSQGDVLTKKEEALVKKTQEKEPVLAQLKVDVKAIQAVEDKLDQALNTLFKQIDVCNEYEQRAWNNFKDIARELNDKEARKSYYQTQALLDDIKKIQAYLMGAFSTYFDQTVQLARDHAQKITANMQNLRNQGIDLQKEALLLENDRDEPQEKAGAHKKKEDAKQKSQEMGFFGRITQFFRDLYDTIAGWFSSTGTKVKARAKKIEKEADQQVEHVKEVIKKDAQAVATQVRRVGNELAEDYQAGLFGAQPPVAQPGYAHKTATQAVAEESLTYDDKEGAYDAHDDMSAMPFGHEDSTEYAQPMHMNGRQESGQ